MIVTIVTIAPAATGTRVNCLLFLSFSRLRAQVLALCRKAVSLTSG